MTVIYAHRLRIFSVTDVHSVTYMTVIYATKMTVIYVYSLGINNIYDSHICVYTPYLLSHVCIKKEKPDEMNL